MRLSAAKLRQNLYQILDLVLKNRIPVEVERNGYILKIVPDESEEDIQTTAKLSQLEPHDTIVGDPESIIHIDWTNEWKGEINV
jgi:hypothetical protein